LSAKRKKEKEGGKKGERKKKLPLIDNGRLCAEMGSKQIFNTYKYSETQRSLPSHAAHESGS
jgi:hypothetical protein